MRSVSDAFKAAAVASQRRVLVKVECYFGEAATDITAYVQRFEVQAERYYEQQGSIPLGNFAAGEVMLTLANVDGRFSPENTSGPYYGFLLPNRKIVVQLGFDTSDGEEMIQVGEFYSLSWNVSTGPTAIVRARDKSVELQRRTHEAAVAKDKTVSQMIDTVATAAGFSDVQRLIDTTTTVVSYGVFDREPFWDHLRDLAVGEGGCIYIDWAGRLVFESRDHLMQTTQSVLTLNDVSHIVRLHQDLDVQRIRNRILVRRRLLTAAAETTIWSLDETLTVPGTSPWWLEPWGRRRNISITAAGGANNDLTTGHTIRVRITGEAATEIYANSLANRHDVRIVYRDDEAVYHDVTRRIWYFSSSEIEIYFKPHAAIDAGDTDDKYWIYYDNPDAGAPSEDISEVFRHGDAFDRATIGSDWDFDATVYDIAANELRAKTGPNANDNCVWDQEDTQSYVEVGVKARVSQDHINFQFGVFCYSGKHWVLQYGAGLKSDGAGKAAPWIRTFNQGFTYGTAIVMDVTQMHRITLTRQANTWKVWIDGVQGASCSDATGSSWYGVLQDLATAGKWVYFDDWFVRLITATDPTIVVGMLECTPSPGGENTLTIQIRFDGPATDIQAPVITEGGPDLSVGPYEYYSCTGWIIIENTGPSQTISGLTVDGKLLEESDTISAVAIDQDSIDAYGEQSFELSNVFIQSDLQAEAMAQGLLAEYTKFGREITIDMPNRAQPHLELGDRITVQNENTGINADYHIVRIRLKYDGGLGAELTCVAAT